MDKFETQFEDMDVMTGYYENATSQATAVATPQDDVDRLIGQVADEAGVELGQELGEASKADPSLVSKKAVGEGEEDGYVQSQIPSTVLFVLHANLLSSTRLGERLRALRS